VRLGFEGDRWVTSVLAYEANASDSRPERRFGITRLRLACSDPSRWGPKSIGLDLGRGCFSSRQAGQAVGTEQRARDLEEGRTEWRSGEAMLGWAAGIRTDDWPDLHGPPADRALDDVIHDQACG